MPWLVGAIVLAAGDTAHAHWMDSGFGPFYDGLAHPFVTPEDLLPVIAMALLAGLSGPRCGRWVLFALPLAWLAGMTASWAPGARAWPGWSSCVLTVLLGALVAADRRLPLAVVIGLAALLGATHGLGNGRELSAAKGGMLAMWGIVCALFALVSLPAGQVASVRAQWARVAVRVAGSWIAAIGLLMLGWQTR